MSFCFPKETLVKKKIVQRSFQSAWFKRWAWIHYDEVNDKALCHTCVKAYQANMLSNACLEPAFLSSGYTNWKDATAKKGGFPAHEKSNCHKEALERLVSLPSVVKDVGESISQIHEEEKVYNRHVLLKILSNIRFLARQGSALRGSGSGKDSNFLQLYYLRSEDNPVMLNWITKKTDKYVSGDIQNEMLQVMALNILRKVASEIRSAEFFSIMIDETTDISNKEQVVLCIRWLDTKLESHEDFIGLYCVESIDADTLTKVIKDILLRMNLSLSNCRGQCYDGCSAMTGKKKGVATQIKKIEPRSLYTHCYGHALNLACSDSIKNSMVIKNALETSFKITKLIKNSPKRDSHLDQIKLAARVEDNQSQTPGIRLFCPTRWTVRSETLYSIIMNFEFLQELWDWSLCNCSDTDMKARLRGVSSHMERFDFYFGLHLGQNLLSHADNLSRCLQHKNISAVEGQSLALTTVNTLKDLRSDTGFDIFWQKPSLAAHLLWPQCFTPT